MAVSAPSLLVTALVKAAAGATRPGHAVFRATRRGAPSRPSPPAAAHGPPARLLAAIANITLILATELVGILGSHVLYGHNDNDEDYHDNHGQDEHELSHRTIQQGMAS